MKKKTVIVSLLAAALASGGSIWGGIRYSSSRQKPVNVVPVANVNYMSDWGNMSEDSQSGTIVTRDAQEVELDNDLKLSKVFVQAGDKVEPGDKLLEYDMTLPTLQREMESLNNQLLNIQLRQQQASLAKLQKGIIPDSDSDMDSASDSEEDDMTGSGELIESPEEPAGSDTGGETSAEDSGQGEIITDNQNTSSGTASGGNGGGSAAAPLIEDAGTVTNGTEVTGDTGRIADNGEGSLPNQLEQDTEISLDTNEIVLAGTNLIQRAGLILGEKAAEVSQDELSKAFAAKDKVFVPLANDVDTVTDLLNGQQRSLTGYGLNEEARRLVRENTITQTQADDFFKALAIISRADFYYYYYQLVPEGSTPDSLELKTLKNSEPQLSALLNAYYTYLAAAKQMQRAAGYPEYAAQCGISPEAAANLTKYCEDILDETRAAPEAVQRLVYRFRNEELMTEKITEDMTELYDGSFDAGGIDTGITSEDMTEMIRAQEAEIKETQLQIRESDLQLKQYDRKLAKQFVKASVKGVVISAGTKDGGGGSENGFIVISGQKGLYLLGAVNELDLDSVHLGDKVQGTSYDSGMTFTGEITEISTYPSDSDNSMMEYYGSENPNASYYPFYAKIDNEEGLSEGDVDYTIEKEESGTQIYLENFYVRTDERGKSYVFCRGADGLLKKKYVKTGKSMYGIAVQILSGLTIEDQIAFPYGKYVKEGAQTKTVESLGDDSMYY